MMKLIFELIAPHYCCSCDKIGTIFCESCKYDIISEPKTICLGCKRPASDGVSCSSCALPYARAWTLGERTEALQRLVNISKYESCREGCVAQAEMLHQIIPTLPQDIIVTAVPTIDKHIRERGYDHAARIAKYFASLRKLAYQDALVRLNDYVQQGASRSDRLKQAAKSYKTTNNLVPERPYLLIDDVLTTGATLEYASKALLAAGVKTVWVAVTSYQSDR